jgi:hypothetical protein
MLVLGLRSTLVLATVQVCSAQAGRQVIYKSKDGTSKGIGNLNSAFEKANRLLEQKLTGSQLH